MNVLSLFSGIGGLDLGLERAGMTVVGQVEIDPWCRQILAKHWPEVPRHDDVRTCVEWWQSTERPHVDLMCGGVPCQPVSLAGLGLAQEDPRWLWPATIDAIGVLRPRYALLENVPGLLARGMGDVLGHLAEVGYDAEWDCVPASAVGAPHRRDRVWIVAYPGSARRREVTGSAHGDEGQDAWRPAAHDHVLGSPGEKRLSAVADADGAGRGEQRWPESIRAELPAAERSRQALADASSERRREGPRLIGRMGAAKRSPGMADAHRQPLGWAAITRRQCDHWLTEPDVGRVAHGIPRRVDRLRGLGNAVVPQVAEHIGRLIMEAAA